jgi:hypothetical protein
LSLKRLLVLSDRLLLHYYNDLGLLLRNDSGWLMRLGRSTFGCKKQKKMRKQSESKFSNIDYRIIRHTYIEGRLVVRTLVPPEMAVVVALLKHAIKCECTLSRQVYITFLLN